MNLVVDSGNTSTKVAVMDGETTVREWRFDRFTQGDADAIIAGYSPSKVIVASTGGDGERICAMLEGRVGFLLRMSPLTPVPIGIDYDTPQTLGTDRIAAAVGAVEVYGAGDMLIVDMGTAITFDFVEGGVFRGGNISLGVGSRFRALHDYTAHLPQCGITEIDGSLGRSTRTAIEQGVMRSVLYEIKGYADELLQKNPQSRIIFCGGDAKCFVNRIKNAIFANCNMMYIGLNRILEYNATNDDK